MAEGEEKSTVLPFVTGPLPHQQRPRPAASSEPLLNVLVIDDTPEDRMAVRFALEAGGFVLQEASNADKGIALARASTPDCILLDYALPDLEGLEVLEALRRLDGRLPCAVVMFSGSGKADVATAALKAGALDYLIKDRFDADTLRRSIRSTVRQFELLEAQRVAERRNAQLAAIVASSSDAIISVGMDQMVQSWNPGAQQLFGYTEVEAVGRSVVELIIPEEKEAERLAIFDSVKGGKAAVLKETARRRNDGSLVQVELNASPILDAFGRVAALSLVFRDITERHGAEAALRESEARFRSLANTTPAIIWTSDGRGNITFHNQRWLDYTGMDPADNVCDWPRRVLHPDDYERCMSVWTQALRTGSDYEIEVRNRHHSGDYRWFLTRATPIRDDTGAIVAWYGSTTDIHDHKMAQERLRCSEAFRRSVFEASPDCVKILTLDGRLEEMNANGRNLMEIDDFETVRGQIWSSLWPDAVAHDIDRALSKAAHGDIGRFSAFRPTAKGTPKWWDVVVTAVPDIDGRAFRLLSAARDITAARQAEQKLRESEERYRGIFEHAGVSLWEEDFSEVKGKLDELKAAGATDLRAYLDNRPELVGELLDLVRIKDVNESTVSLFGAESKDALLRSLADIFTEVTREVFVDELVALWEGRQQLASETRLRTLAGEPLDVMFTIVFGGEKAERTLVSVLDITPRKRAEADLREAEERYRTIVNTAQEGIWAVDRRAQTIFANPRLAELLGTSTKDLSSRSLADFLFPEDIDFGNERLAANLAGQTEEFEIRFRRADGSALHALAATAPLRGDKGEIIGALGGFVDLSERKKAEERQRMLMREVAHRGKNLLAVVQSIAGRTLTGDKSLDEARTAFIGRLQALSRTYSSLTEEVFEGALLDEIVGSELRTFTGRARFDGPKVMLTAKVAQTFALIAHELATNAAKYGALSVPDGHVDIKWRLDGEGDARRFRFEWRERGGPPSRPPTRRGFGTQLISTVAGSELHCSPEIAYAADGFSYRLDAPLSAVGTMIDDSPVRQRLRSEAMRTFFDVWAGQLGQDGQLPQFERFDRKRFEAMGGLTVASISDNGDVRFVEVGRALTERLGRLISQEDVATDEPDSLADAYRRCARGGVPCYEHLRFDFGDDNVVTFERLLVPFSRGGPRVTHIAGLVVYSGRTRVFDDASTDAS